MLPAFYNGYPLIYSDTSTYLASGFILQPPMDRPMTYGLFIRFFSLNGLSLWPVIFMQSFILAWLLQQLIGSIFKKLNRWNGPIFMALVAAAGFSGAALTTCYLIPDIFTSLMLLSASLILISPAGRWKGILYFVIYVFATAMHSSHIPFGISLLSILLLAGLLWKEQFGFLKIKTLLILATLTLATIFSMGSSLSKSKHVFLMGAFIEQGIIKAYLDEHCLSNDYQLCTYKDSLPDFAWEFLWEDSSPLYKMGGWKETKEEYTSIIRQTFLSPKYFLLHLKTSLKATAVQLISFEGLDYRSVAPNASVLESRVENYVPLDIQAYRNSRQNSGSLTGLKWLNFIQLLLTIFSLILTVFLFLIYPVLRKNRILVLLVVFLLLGVLVNAWVCGTFANPINRLGNRMIWLLPVASLLVFFRLKEIRRNYV